MRHILLQAAKKMASTAGGCILFLLLVGALCEDTNYSILDFGLARKHEEWMVEHGRVYKDEAERAQRFEIFKQTLKFVEEFNAAGEHNYTVGLNEFSDLTDEEFHEMYTGFIPELEEEEADSSHEPEAEEYEASALSLPGSVDWRKNGAVTPIRNQGGCASCWAFTSAATIETLTKIKGGDLTVLSPQHLVDCAYNLGCKRGGWMTRAYDYVKSNNGIASEKTYPYRTNKGSCQKSKANKVAASIKGYVVVHKNTNALKEAVAKGAVAVAVDTKTQAFKSYKSGVYDGPCDTEIDHAVTVIGYDQQDGKKYWIVKNSWGTTWGEKGYMKLKMDESRNSYGTCGVNRMASYPTK